MYNSDNQLFVRIVLPLILKNNHNN